MSKIFVNQLKKVIKSLMGRVYFQSPPLTWDVESWLRSEILGAEILKVIVENGSPPSFQLLLLRFKLVDRFAWKPLWGHSGDILLEFRERW